MRRSSVFLLLTLLGVPLSRPAAAQWARGAIQRFGPREGWEREVLRLLAGGMRNEEIGRELGLTRERVRQLEAHALATLSREPELVEAGRRG